MDFEILRWVVAALERIGSNSAQLDADDAGVIISQAKNIFIQGNPRAFWMGLKGDVKVYDSNVVKLESVLPNSEDRYWFIPETEENALPVFELSFAEIEQVLNECPFFEYNILSKKFKWLVAESDHNRFYVGRPNEE